VLMVGYMDREALHRTVASGEVYFWSRSRRQLWHKGETSGNFLVVEQIQMDCDDDAILISVRPKGPTCHLGRRACFAEPGILTDHLQSTLESRRDASPENSYTAELFQAGLPAICRKVGEEATEVILAAHQDDRAQLVAEVADLWYHTLVLLVSAGLSVDAVLYELASRVGRPRRDPKPCPFLGSLARRLDRRYLLHRRLRPSAGVAPMARRRSPI
ncbi:MAG: bifunctional phosphoribosyl-AMP cyclohydrolase/phosphoribosyl-ATP diphosphatase HisIE, partial [Candidatus Dormiibacterota bacterium]